MSGRMHWHRVRPGCGERENDPANGKPFTRRYPRQFNAAAAARFPLPSICYSAARKKLLADVEEAQAFLFLSLAQRIFASSACAFIRHGAGHDRSREG